MYVRRFAGKLRVCYGDDVMCGQSIARSVREYRAQCKVCLF